MATHTTTPTSSAARPAASAVDAAVLSAQLLGLQDEFDMSSFQGRLGFFLRIVNPKHMLTSAADIAAAKHTVHEHHRVSELRRGLEARLARQKGDGGAGACPAETGGGGGEAARSGLWAWGWQSVSYYVGLDGGGAAPPHSTSTTDSDAAAETEALMRSCQQGGPSAADAANARWTLAGTVHPKSGEAIALPFRMAAWPWFGAVPVSGLMYLARYRPTDLGLSAAGQWWNQSQNGLTNFSNGAAANGSDETTAVFVQGYVGAVGAAMALALGAGVLAKQRFMARFKSVLLFVPFPAVAGANVVNTYLLRRHEIVSGIDVVDEDGTVVGQSVVAAKEAIRKTCVTRVVIPACNFVIAPLCLFPFAKTLSATTWLRYPVCFGVTLGVFLVWLPASLALYPQRCELDVAELEPELAAKTKGSIVVYNKGL